MTVQMKLAAAGICAFLSAGIFHASSYGSEFTDGQRLFQEKNYRAAAAKFERSMLSSPNANTIYFCAVAQQLSNNRSRARQLYEYVVRTYPGTSVASLSAQAARSLGLGVASTDAFVHSMEGNNSFVHSANAGVSRNSYIGPDIVRVPFSRGRGGGVYVEALFNGKPVLCHLDTGAYSTLIGANRMEELGLSRPAAGPKFETLGVGERQHINAWTQKVDLKLGSIYRKDFVLTVQDQFDGDPLLGQDFMGDCDTTIDENNRQVVFRRRGASSAAGLRRGKSVDVPFTYEGRHMVVDGQVNGRPYEFYFDTGADGIVFTVNDMKRLGIEIPSDARQGLTNGIAGSTLTYNFPIAKLKVGSLIKEDCPVSVIEQGAMGHPLLGQSFFTGYNVDIDSTARVIHFTAAN